MAFSLTWLPAVLTAAGLKVAEQPGWVTRGRGEMGTVRGVMCHHTASGARSGNMPGLGGLTTGVRRQDGSFLAGPLSQLGLGRDGTFYVIAAGRANHAGAGSWRGLTNGNFSFIGIEAENSGFADDAWPEVQMDAYRRGVAALLTRIGAPVDMCCAHKEYAPARKPVDPRFDMTQFRAHVAAIMAGTGVVRPLIPAADPGGRPTLRRGSRGEPVKVAQRKAGAEDDGIYGPDTEARMREFQRGKGLVPDGIVGPRTWAEIDKP
ncbi:MAG TPA: N-acetylmuramoyl-L-alanine amidase [Allosphingosinicella sp.]|nr:N-acetylmuramoyl-L-alanine amidase [Allosphingosinicella sp.]